MNEAHTGSGRPAVLVVVAGTGTEVGKTWVTCRLARLLRERGTAVAARKLAQSFDRPGVAAPPNDLLTGADLLTEADLLTDADLLTEADLLTDAELLSAATGEPPTAVCPAHRWYPRAMAPPMAAESLGLVPFTLTEVLGELSWPAGTAVGLVEQAGGLGSPQASDGDGADLVSLLAPDCVVLVAEAGLGTLSSIRLAAKALPGAPLVVFLNRFDPAVAVHLANRRWLAGRWGLTVAVSPEELVRALPPAPPLC
jgi:dethiobiotin synthetase